MFAYFNFFTVSVLITSDLNKCLGLSLALLLYLHPAEVLGDQFQLSGTLVMITMIPMMVTRMMIVMHTKHKI